MELRVCVREEVVQSHTEDGSIQELLARAGLLCGHGLRHRQLVAAREMNEKSAGHLKRSGGPYSRHNTGYFMYTMYRN